MLLILALLLALGRHNTLKICIVALTLYLV